MRIAIRLAQGGLWLFVLWRVLAKPRQSWNPQSLAVIVGVAALFALVYWQQDRLTDWLQGKRWFESFADVLVPLAGLTLVGSLIWQAAKLASNYGGWWWGVGAGIAVLIGFFWLMGGVFDGQAKRRAAEEARAAGDFEKAERLLKEGIAEAGKVKAGSAANKATLHWDLADLYKSFERWEEAEREVRAAVVSAGDSQSPLAEQIRECAPALLSQLLARQEKWKELAEETEFALRGRNSEEAAAILQEKAAALLYAKQPGEAIELLIRALKLAQLGNSNDTTARSYRMLAIAQLGCGRTEEGIQTLLELDAFAFALPEKERLFWEVASRDLIAQGALRIGNPARALQAVEEAMKRVEQLNDHNSEARGQRLFIMSEALLGLGRRDEARATAMQGVSLWDSAGVELTEDVRSLLARVEAVEA